MDTSTPPSSIPAEAVAVDSSYSIPADGKKWLSVSQSLLMNNNNNKTSHYRFFKFLKIVFIKNSFFVPWLFIIFPTLFVHFQVNTQAQPLYLSLSSLHSITAHNSNIYFIVWMPQICLCSPLYILKFLHHHSTIHSCTVLPAVYILFKCCVSLNGVFRGDISSLKNCNLFDFLIKYRQCRIQAATLSLSLLKLVCNVLYFFFVQLLYLSL